MHDIINQSVERRLMCIPFRYIMCRHYYYYITSSVREVFLSFSPDIWLNLTAALRRTFWKFAGHVRRVRRTSRTLITSIPLQIFMTHCFLTACLLLVLLQLFWLYDALLIGNCLIKVKMIICMFIAVGYREIGYFVKASMEYG